MAISRGYWIASQWDLDSLKDLFPKYVLERDRRWQLGIQIWPPHSCTHIKEMQPWKEHLVGIHKALCLQKQAKQQKQIETRKSFVKPILCQVKCEVFSSLFSKIHTETFASHHCSAMWESFPAFTALKVETLSCSKLTALFCSFHEWLLYRTWKWVHCAVIMGFLSVPGIVCWHLVDWLFY